MVDVGLAFADSWMSGGTAMGELADDDDDDDDGEGRKLLSKSSKPPRLPQSSDRPVVAEESLVGNESGDDKEKARDMNRSVSAWSSLAVPPNSSNIPSREDDDVMEFRRSSISSALSSSSANSWALLISLVMAVRAVGVIVADYRKFVG